MPIEPERLERLRKNPAWISWSKSTVDQYNKTVTVAGQVKFASIKTAQKNAETWSQNLNKIETEIKQQQEAISKANFSNIPIDPKDINRAKTPEWLEFFLIEGMTFETANANAIQILTETRERLEEKAKLHFIGTDTDTGREIFYDPETKEYIEVNKEGKETMRSKDLEITETVSIETGQGHEVPFIAEISANVRVTGLDTEEIKEKEKTIQTTLSDYFHSKPGFGQIYAEARLKEGIEYRIRKTTAPTDPTAKVKLEKTHPTKWMIGENIDLDQTYTKSPRPSIKKEAKK